METAQPDNQNDVRLFDGICFHLQLWVARDLFVPHKQFGLLQAQAQLADEVVQLSATDLDINSVVPTMSEK